MFEILKNNKKLLTVHIIAAVVFVGVIVVVIYFGFLLAKNKSQDINRSSSNVADENIEENQSNMYDARNSDAGILEPEQNDASTAFQSVGTWKKIGDSSYIGNASIKVIWVNELGDGYDNAYVLGIDQSDLDKLPIKVYGGNVSKVVLRWDPLFISQESVLSGLKKATVDNPINLNIQSAMSGRDSLYVSIRQFPVIDSDKNTNGDNKYWEMTHGNPMDDCFGPIYSGSTTVRGWFEEEKCDADNNPYNPYCAPYVFHIYNFDTDNLPIIFQRLFASGDAAALANNGLLTYLTEDNVSEDLLNKLRKTSPTKMAEVSLSEISTYCEGPQPFIVIDKIAKQYAEDDLDPELRKAMGN
ncbi:MAG: hypothetical protein WC457_03065 [Patescibacteria group bacterium]